MSSRLTTPVEDVFDEAHFSTGPLSELDQVSEFIFVGAAHHDGVYLHMPLGWRLDALNSAGNCLLLRTYTSGRDSDLDAAEGFYQSAIAGSPMGWANLPKYHHNLGRALYLRDAGTQQSRNKFGRMSVHRVIRTL